MRPSFLSAVLAASLLLECSVLSGALPLSLPDDGSVEQDALAALLADKTADRGLGDGELEERAGGGGGGAPPRLMLVADPGLWRELRALHAAGLAGLGGFIKRQSDPESNLKDGPAPAPGPGPGQDLNIPILRRNSMRCMVGRVYRPCWEA